MSDLQKVLVRKQNEDCKVVKTDTLELEYLQSQVGGLIELISWSDNLDSLGVDMWINEDGKLIEGLGATFIVVDKQEEIRDVIYGDVIFTSTDSEGNTIGLNDIQIQSIKREFGKKVAVLQDGSIAHIIRI